MKTQIYATLAVKELRTIIVLSAQRAMIDEMGFAVKLHNPKWREKIEIAGCYGIKDAGGYKLWISRLIEFSRILWNAVTSPETLFNGYSVKKNAIYYPLLHTLLY